MRAVVAGHVCLDMVSELPGPLSIDPGSIREVGAMRVTPGGCVYNTGSALAELGVEVTLVARIGADMLGEMLASQFRREALPAELQISSAAATSYSIVFEGDGIDRSFWHHVGACGEFDGAGVEFTAADVLHIGYPSLLPKLLVDVGSPLTALLESAHRQGLVTSLDLATVDNESSVAELPWKDLLERIFAQTDVVSPSIVDLQSALGDDSPITPDTVSAYAQWILNAGSAVAAVSIGDHGSYIAVANAARLRRCGPLLANVAPEWSGYRAWIPPVEIQNIATTRGAGDAHSAGFLAGLLGGYNPRAAAQYAAESAGAAIQGLRVGESLRGQLPVIKAASRGREIADA